MNTQRSISQSKRLGFSVYTKFIIGLRISVHRNLCLLQRIKTPCQRSGKCFHPMNVFPHPIDRHHINCPTNNTEHQRRFPFKTRCYWITNIGYLQIKYMNHSYSNCRTKGFYTITQTRSQSSRADSRTVDLVAKTDPYTNPERAPSPILSARFRNWL